MKHPSGAARRRATLTMVAFALCMAILFSGGRAVERVSAVPKETYDELETFTNILSIVQKNYVDDVTTKQLVEGAVNGMLGALDPHSAYLTPELYKELQRCKVFNEKRAATVSFPAFPIAFTWTLKIETGAED